MSTTQISAHIPDDLFCIEIAEAMRDEVGCVGLVVDAEAQPIDFFRRYGFTVVNEEEGGARVVPRPTMMFLPLGSIPPKR